jgi:hypothetical protein
VNLSCALILFPFQEFNQFFHFPRSHLQNGFWGLKFLLLFAGVFGSFFIPHGSFGPTWMYFGLGGAFLFILVQLILIIDFAHSWAEHWQENYRCVKYHLLQQPQS